MDRRAFLRSALLVPAVPGALRGLSLGEGPRTFTITTRVSVLTPSGATRIWLPAPIRHAPFQTLLRHDVSAPGGTARLLSEATDELAMIAAEFPAGTPPVLTTTALVRTVPFGAAFVKPRHPVSLSRPVREHFLRSTRLIPTDGIVHDTAAAIVQARRSELDNARAIYEWVVEHTFRDASVNGCGIGDIQHMLASGNLGGKCADLNALFVGLCRAAGLPARDVYGLRVGPSVLGYTSLGISSTNATKAQHCRAEVFVSGYGWIPVDPADVRKVALEEAPGGLPLDDLRVRAARSRLFGSWEMNWIGYNFAHDVRLPGSTRAPDPFLMYPQAETARGAIESLDATNFRYEITARETP